MPKCEWHVHEGHENWSMEALYLDMFLAQYGQHICQRPRAVCWKHTEHMDGQYVC